MKKMIPLLLLFCGCVAQPEPDPGGCYIYEGGVRASSCVDYAPDTSRTEAQRFCDDLGGVYDEAGCFEIGTVARCTVVLLPDGLMFTERYYAPWTVDDARVLCAAFDGYFEVNP